MCISKKAFIILFAALMICARMASADEIRLKNGDRLSGNVIRMEEGKLLFSTTYAGEIAIVWDTIATIVTEDAVNVVLSDDTTLKGFTKPSEEGTMKLKMGKIIETASFDLAEVKSINAEPKATEPPVKISGHANLGGTKKKGNTDREAYHMDAELVARTEKNRYTIGGEFNRAKDDGDKTDDNVLGYMKYDHFLNHQWYFFNNASFENDEFKDLRLRTAIGAGLGYQFWEKELLNLSLESGVGYISEDYYDGDDDNYVSGRWALKCDKFLFNKALQFFHFHEGFLGFEDTSDIYIRSRTGFRLPVYKIFNATVQYNYDWDNSPAPGRDKEDETILYTIGCQW